MANEDSDVQARIVKVLRDHMERTTALLVVSLLETVMHSEDAPLFTRLIQSWNGVGMGVTVVAKNGLLCSVCGEPQYESAFGTTCENGHARARGVKPPKSRRKK